MKNIHKDDHFYTLKRNVSEEQPEENVLGNFQASVNSRK